MAWKQQLTENPTAVILQLEKARNQLSSSVISDLASQLATLPQLREITLDFQRQLTDQKG